MTGFFDNLSTVQQFFYFVAIPSTVILIIQTIMTVFGLSEGDDFEVGETAEDMDGSADFRFFSVRGLVAFFTIFGWVGIVLSEQNVPVMLNLLISLVAGLIAMVLVGYLFHSINKLQSNGSITLKNAIGRTGEVYIPIPPNRKGIGKIQLLMQERYIEVDAITDDSKQLKTGSVVEVIDLLNVNTVIVRGYNNGK
ncbi:hypothetical protein EDC19_1850 [Natranaerovirga hydrolytica]|uniref:NfeD-like partner-binding protein n=1 Tax=Natranaerovirga hydrolytica TaxID=680378 RepID=A0A4R1MJR7_9FIRM|nr:hypothetical protein [Natranaerovirga hydrolytica]TCK92695.1 hypothetical protein EDC19_1850 [Natranaerovirga hydrolytica]